MSLQRIFSIAMAAVSLIGIYGALPLQMFRGTSLGPGLMPLLCAVLLFICAVVYFFTDKTQPKIQWKSLLQGTKWDGVVFFLSNIGMFIILYFFGTIAAMTIFTFASLLLIRRMTVVQAAIFTVGWVAALYLIFVVLLKMNMESGILFR